MKMKFLAIASAILMASLAFGTSAALAGRPDGAGPMDVDCGVLESTLIAIDQLAEEIFPEPLFKNWGQVVAEMQNDPEFFGFVSLLIQFLSEGQIVFTSANQGMATVAKCGLMSLQVQNVNNSGPATTT